MSTSCHCLTSSTSKTSEQSLLLNSFFFFSDQRWESICELGCFIIFFFSFLLFPSGVTTAAPPPPSNPYSLHSLFSQGRFIIQYHSFLAQITNDSITCPFKGLVSNFWMASYQLIFEAKHQHNMGIKLLLPSLQLSNPPWTLPRTEEHIR